MNHTNSSFRFDWKLILKHRFNMKLNIYGLFELGKCEC